MNKKLQKSSMNAGTPDNEKSNSQLIERKAIDNFFTGVKKEDENWFIALGNYKVTESQFLTFKDAENYILNMGIDWRFLTNIMGIIVEIIKNQSK
jgi:hypothetical protein